MTTYALNTQSGQVGEVNPSWIGHPVLGKYLVEVEKGHKSYTGRYKPRTAEEYLAERAAADEAAKPKPAPKAETKKDSD